MSHTFCTGCGARIEEDSAFCTICGLSATAAAPDAPSPETDTQNESFQTDAPPADTADYGAQSARAQDAHTQTSQAAQTTPHPPNGSTWPSPQAFYETPPSPYGRYGLMTTAQILGSLLLMIIPGIGWLIAIVWAAGGCRKENKQSLARAYLILFVFCSFIFLACLFVFWPWFVAFWNELIARFPIHFYWG